MTAGASMAVSIVSHGHGAELGLLLDDLARLNLPDCVKVIVTLNIAEAETFDRARWPFVTWIANAEPKGFATNHNQALLTRPQDLFAIINPDIRLEMDVFRMLGEALYADPSLALVAPLVLDEERRVADSARALPTPWRIVQRTLTRAMGLTPRTDALAAPDWIAGMFYLVRSDRFRAIGGFDARWFLYGEDVDLCIRLRLRGWGLKLFSEAHVLHVARRSSHRSLRYLRWHVRSLARLWCSPHFWRYWWRHTGHDAASGAAGSGRSPTDCPEGFR
jgi:GT2 family glycosyltransferase